MSDYDKDYGVRTDHSGYRIVVRFDKQRGTILRFVVQLQEQQRLGEWKTIAQIDHHPSAPNGHDVYDEGLHVDIYHSDGSSTKLWPRHNQLPTYPGAVVRVAVDYLEEYIPLFRRIAAGDIDPSRPPEL